MAHITLLECLPKLFQITLFLCEITFMRNTSSNCLVHHTEIYMHRFVIGITLIDCLLKLFHIVIYFFENKTYTFQLENWDK